MELTKAEEQILHYLWKLEEATVQDILSCMDDAGKPSRTTVSTIIRILENKGAVSHKPGTGINRVQGAVTFIILWLKKKSTPANSFLALSAVILITPFHPWLLFLPKKVI